jgi:alpha-tubulin suppressor-like RCC1 family protein
MDDVRASKSRPTRVQARRAPAFHSCVWLAALSLAACSDGTSPPVEPEPLRFTAITASTGATCGLAVEGDAYCWGSSFGGLFGARTLEQCPPTQFACTTRPLRIHSPVQLTSVSANSTFGSYACGLDTSGLPYCWGTMLVDFDGAYNLGLVPTALPGGVPLTSISMGEAHICGVATTHEAYCWGTFEGGRRGDPLIGFDTSTATFQPNAVGGGLDFAEVVAGSMGTCGLTLTGQAYCWGSNYHGSLGDPAAPVQQECGLARSPCATAPVPVAGGHLFTALTGATGHVCGPTAAGELYCWGLDNANQLGTGEPPELCDDALCVNRPALVLASGVVFTSVSAAGSSTCALDADDVAFCWGDNSSGQIGNGGGMASVPVPVSGDRRFKTIAIAGDHACALTADGEAFCWGENSAGQLGTGDQRDSNEPVAVVGPVAE